MEYNFRWKIYRQSQSNNIHICLVNADVTAVVEMTSKKIFEIKPMLRACCIFLGKIYARFQYLPAIYRKSSDLETIFKENVVFRVIAGS
jgi:hypothetical protein